MLSYYSIWPSAACLAAAWCLAASPLFAAADDPPVATRDRVATLDGLRGFLALGVVLHHAAIYHGFLASGSWDNLPPRFYQSVGPLAVDGFFMVTGFLFWGQVTNGRRTDWTRLYVGRVFRIVPLYLVAAGATLAVAFGQNGFGLAGPVDQAAGETLAWMGLRDVFAGDLDGLPRVGVTWTLRYEWAFYAALPLAAALAHAPARRMIVPAALVACLAWATWRPSSYFPPSRSALVALFLFGMACAEHRGRAATGVGRTARSALAVAAACAAFAFDNPYSAGAIASTGTAFWLVATGSDVFGLLRTRAAATLGNISYGIYLLQGLALTATMRPERLRRLGLDGPWGHWAEVAAACLVLVLAALAAHVLVERPGIALGKRACAGLREFGGRPPGRTSPPAG